MKNEKKDAEICGSGANFFLLVCLYYCDGSGGFRRAAGTRTEKENTTDP